MWIVLHVHLWKLTGRCDVVKAAMMSVDESLEAVHVLAMRVGLVLRLLHGDWSRNGIGGRSQHIVASLLAASDQSIAGQQQWPPEPRSTSPLLSAT
jgi:hypothetical protein